MLINGTSKSLRGSRIITEAGWGSRSLTIQGKIGCREDNLIETRTRGSGVVIEDPLP